MQDLNEEMAPEAGANEEQNQEQVASAPEAPAAKRKGGRPKGSQAKADGAAAKAVAKSGKVEVLTNVKHGGKIYEKGTLLDSGAVAKHFLEHGLAKEV